MPSTSSAVTIGTRIKRDFSYAETFGFFVVEFLLPGSVYSYGVLYIILSKNEHLQPKNELWFPVTAFAVWMITNCWSGALCKYLKTRRYEKTVAIIIISLITMERLSTPFYPDHAFKFFAKGLFEGSCTSLLLTITKMSSSKYYKINTQNYVLLTRVSRALGFLVLPQLFILLSRKYGLMGTEFLFTGILMHMLPAILLIFGVKPQKPLKLNTISESLFYQANDLSDYVVSDSYESRSVSEGSDEYPMYSRVVTKNGVEVLSVIEEENESVVTFNESVYRTNRENSARNHDYEDVNCKCFTCITISLLLVVTTKTILTFIFTTSMALIPHLTNDVFIVLLTASAWMIYTLALSWVDTPVVTKSSIFLFGLLLCACGFSLLNTVSHERVAGSSLLLAFGFGAIVHCENTTEDLLLKDRKFTVSSAKLLSGLFVVCSYTIVYFVGDFDGANLFFVYSLLTLSILILWIVIIITKYACKHI